MVFFHSFFRFVVGKVASDRLEHDVQVAGGAEGGEDAGGIEAVGAEIVEDGAALVEEGFDVDQVDGPESVPEDALTGIEAVFSIVEGEAGALMIVGVGLSEESSGGRWARVWLG